MPHHAHPPSQKTKSPTKPPAEWQQSRTRTDPRENDKGIPAKPGFENEGEGNRTAARRYDAATEDYIRSGSVERAATEAKQALEGPEESELRAAEEIGRKGEPRVDPRGEDSVPDRKNPHRQ